jgi:predicted cupin superfamily sugar epimerase
VPFAFGSCVCAPPFSYDEFAIATRPEMLSAYPQHRQLIERLTKPSPPRP